MLALIILTGLLTGASEFGTQPVVVPSYVVGGSFLDGKKRRYEADDTDDQETEPTPLEIVKIGEAPNEVITGLVIPKRKAANTTTNPLQKIDADRFTANKLKSDRKRAIQLADDEWFLLN